MKWYWFNFRSSLEVVFPGLDHAFQRYRWQKLYGFSIGNWYFGAIKGEPAPPQPQGTADE